MESTTLKKETRGRPAMYTAEQQRIRRKEYQALFRQNLKLKLQKWRTEVLPIQKQLLKLLQNEVFTDESILSTMNLLLNEMKEFLTKQE